MSSKSKSILTFNDLSLSEPVLKALSKVGYETPSPIQSAIIPHLTAGKDVIGQAQTGTGKTAAFALPLLSKIDVKQNLPQVLVLAPTRELAIQVAEAFQRYASFIKDFHVLPIYGGQEYGVQLRQLKRGTHVVVGTPGRVMDHMRRGTLKLDNLKCLVLDEADEMLRMGFIDDVEWVLEQSPKEKQIALFSATMPTAIRNISIKYLNNPEQITVETKSMTADTIRQRFMQVNGRQKLEALTTILESLTFKAIIIFVRTKLETIELSEKLSARGYASTALNGDITQKLREQTINKLKAGKIDILVATDVAARGLDVERISHVINYDIPNDPEAYTHRIGRTGRAGREGETILFVTPREQHLLRIIEKATGKKIERMQLPTADTINQERVQRFKQKIVEKLGADSTRLFMPILEELQHDTACSPIEIASALASLLQGDQPFFVKAMEQSRDKRDDRGRDRDRGDRDRDRGRDRGDRDQSSSRKNRDESGQRRQSKPAHDMERFRIEVGSDHDVKINQIVGAIANEAGIEGQYIKNVTIFDDHALVDLPTGMPKEIFQLLRKVWVAGTQLNISRFGEERKSGRGDKKDKRSGKPKDRHNKKNKGRSDNKKSGKRKPRAAS